MSDTAKHIDLGTHRLRVNEHGRGEPSFLCLHGLADTLEIWSRVTPALAQRGRLVTMDQRGHGESEAPPGPYRRDDLARDVVAVLDRLGISRTILIGHSMGGIVAMTTALAYPERVAGLVLIGTASQCSEAVAGWYEKIARAAETDGLAGLTRVIYGATSTRQLQGDAQGIAHVTRCLKSLYEYPLTPKLSTIGCPAVLLVGDNDPMGPKASVIIQRQMPNAQLEVIADRGHWIHLEAPEAVLAAIDRLLGKHATTNHRVRGSHE
jgi:pimeloyl-ACP methyl ester carboxylesterase